MRYFEVASLGGSLIFSAFFAIVLWSWSQALMPRRLGPWCRRSSSFSRFRRSWASDGFATLAKVLSISWGFVISLLKSWKLGPTVVWIRELMVIIPFSIRLYSSLAIL